MKIGFIGLGNMGGGMAANVLRAGYDLTVHDLRREAATPLLEGGASWADTPAELAASCDIVLTSLPGPREVEAIALGEGGILEGMGEGGKSGGVYIDLSTSSPTLIRGIAEDFAAEGVSVLDAPVSGGPVGARTGRLAVMVGGDRDVYERVKPALDAIGDKVSYIGPVGSGSIAKLMHNCIGYGLQTIVAECLTLGVKAGVDPQPLFEAISNGSVGRGSSFANTYPNTFLAGNFDPPSFALSLAHKGCQPRAGTRARVRRADERGQHRAPRADRRAQSRLGGHGLAHSHDAARGARRQHRSADSEARRRRAGSVGCTPNS